MYINVQGLNVEGKISANVTQDDKGEQIILKDLSLSLKELKIKIAQTGWKLRFPLLRKD